MDKNLIPFSVWLNWGGACQNFVAATNFAGLGALTTVGTPMSKGFAAAFAVGVVASGFTCAAAFGSGQMSELP